MEKTQAILMGRSRISESSLLVTWCTKQFGLLRTRARGALRPASAFAGRLDLFVSAEIALSRPTRGETWTLSEVHLEQSRPGLRREYSRVLAAAYLVRVVQGVVEPLAPVEGLYELLAKALDYLDGHSPSPELIRRFERRVAVDLGLVDVEATAQGETLGRLVPHFSDSLLRERRALLEALQRT